ncbi:MAG: PDZ domain-containing protein [Candidatus Acidiferrum sp.]
MKLFRRTVALILSTALVVCAQGNTFDRVRYNGGSVYSKVDPQDWHNTLTVTSDMIELALHDGTRVNIPPKSVTSLSYGQEAHRRVGTMIALAILVAPVALFGLFHKTRLHFIGIQYTTPDKKSAGILLQGDKDNYRAILVALQGVSGAPVSVGEKEREFVPVGVRTEVTKTEEPSGEASQSATSGAGRASQPQPTQESCVVAIASTPAGADILVDDEFAGNTPSTINIPAGKHVVTVRKTGFQDWTRSMIFYTGSITLSAELLRGAVEPSVSAEKSSATATPAEKLPPMASTSSSAWIGVSAQNSADGVLVTAVDAGGPGATAGIQVGDTIVAVDGRLIKGKDFQSTVAAFKPGTQITINYLRNSSAHEAQIRVGSRM